MPKKLINLLMVLVSASAAAIPMAMKSAMLDGSSATHFFFLWIVTSACCGFVAGALCRVWVIPGMLLAFFVTQSQYHSTTIDDAISFSLVFTSFAAFGLSALFGLMAGYIVRGIVAPSKEVPEQGKS